jgi:hypothetical protein
VASVFDTPDVRMSLQSGCIGSPAWHCDLSR